MSETSVKSVTDDPEAILLSAMLMCMWPSLLLHQAAYRQN